jgi:hypothetical protein
MGYIQDLERELRDVLDDMSKEELIKFFKDKVMESYRNGMNFIKPVRGTGRCPKGRSKGNGQD